MKRDSQNFFWHSKCRDSLGRKGSFPGLLRRLNRCFLRCWSCSAFQWILRLLKANSKAHSSLSPYKQQQFQSNSRTKPWIISRNCQIDRINNHEIPHKGSYCFSRYKFWYPCMSLLFYRFWRRRGILFGLRIFWGILGSWKRHWNLLLSRPLFRCSCLGTFSLFLAFLLICLLHLENGRN